MEESKSSMFTKKVVCEIRHIGKSRRQLYRIHSSAPKIEETNITDYKESPQTYPLANEPIKSNIFRNVHADIIRSNIFENVVIPAEALKQKLHTDSKKDSTSWKINCTLKNAKQSTDKLEVLLGKHERNRGRPERIPMRRKIPFHELVSSAKEFLEKREKEKKKAKDAILTNFNALEEALPTLEQLMDKKNKDDTKPRAAKPFSQQDAEMMEDIQTYQQVLNDPGYAANPIGTITAQLRQRIESGSL